METLSSRKLRCNLLGHNSSNRVRASQQHHVILSRNLSRGQTSVRSQALNDSAPKKVSYTNANFPVDAEGRTYHLGTKKGEVANRVLSVGSTQRALLLSGLLEPPAPGKPLFQLTSSRGFVTITGRFRGVPVSIISTHMGMPNMDFVVRESRAVVDGQLAILRLGTCGAVQPPARLGQMLVASQGSISIRRNPDAWTLGNGHAPYILSHPVPPDADMAALLVEEAAAAVGAENVVQGVNASADSFYSSQGRTGTDFDDRNEELLTEVCRQYPSLISLEMETFQLLDLARCSKGSLRGIGMCIALAERYSGAFLDHERLSQAELAGGKAALAALARVVLQADVSLAPSAAANGKAGSAVPAAAAPQIKYVWH
mmetsp:Transcript_11383/g.24464  ORF Transcript_11383/g.24464 Transcript_11383/m.24464 type:complete len:371 (-) Transcript_11383:889-2001(-)